MDIMFIWLKFTFGWFILPSSKTYNPNLSFVRVSMILIATFVLSLLVHNLSFFWCLKKDVFRDCGYFMQHTAYSEMNPIKVNHSAALLIARFTVGQQTCIVTDCVLSCLQRNAYNLAAVFYCTMIARTTDAMAPESYILSRPFMLVLTHVCSSSPRNYYNIFTGCNSWLWSSFFPISYRS